MTGRESWTRTRRRERLTFSDLPLLTAAWSIYWLHRLWCWLPPRASKGAKR